MRRLTLLIVTIVLCLNATAETPYNSLWQKANTFYQNKQYDSAAAYYEQLAAQKPENAEVYYNLGNAYYRLNEVGPAVLNYERALRLQPSYKNAQENLTLTKNRIKNRISEPEPIFFVRWWKSLSKPSLANVWAITSLVFFLILLGMLAYVKLNRNSYSYIRPQLIAAVSFIWVVILALSIFSSRKRLKSNYAVVMQQEAFMVQPDKKSDSLTIPEGTTVKLLETQGELQRVRLPDGRNGWIPQQALTEI